MPTSRREMLKTAAMAGLAASFARAAEPPTTVPVTKETLDRILDEPVLKTDFLNDPVIVQSIELLRNGKTFLLRTRSAAGAEAITVPNSDRIANTYPLILNQIVPVFLN